ncbi:hypothetical protein HPB52_007995 [Rhipicephalus sanguineus]|uniref:Uncharacterized protein n=1 Tax=Rhipicephalus sanguineus TaxID=34632 RepID=A0A9D4T3B3_RHISA|nr:hypothetical protein HPB52_007995 [Rhipicephalus sanguineus]
MSRALAPDGVQAPKDPDSHCFGGQPVRRVPAINAHNPAYLEILKGLGEELARVQNSTDGTALMLALKATAAAKRRRARQELVWSSVLSALITEG